MMAEKTTLNLPVWKCFFSAEHMQIRILKILSRIILVLPRNAFNYFTATLALQVKNKFCR